MKLRKSILNGALEVLVDDFIAAVTNEHDLIVESVSLNYVEKHDISKEHICHIFRIPTGGSNCSEA